MERCLVWGESVVFAHIDFARTYDSVRRGAVLASTMRRRQVPHALATAYLRELHHTGLAFSNGISCTGRVAPRIGLRQGCAL